MRRWIIGLSIAIVASAAIVALFAVLRRPPAPPPPPDPGIALTLAEDRAARVSDVAYRLSLRIPASRSEPVQGQLTAAFTLSDPSRALSFDFAQPADRLLAVRANERLVSAPIVNGHVTVPATHLTDGANTIELDFLAGDEALNRQDDFLYSLFVPARASVAMPVFDQPDLKARWTLSLTLPPGWTAVSNGKASGTIDRDRSRGVRLRGDAADLHVSLRVRRRTVRGRDGRTQRPHVPHAPPRDGRRESAPQSRRHLRPSRARAELARVGTQAIPYPFGKFDFVLIPSFQFGGMEHPGAIFYNANSLLLDESATQGQLLGRASLISHETAHMWFGDLVTMRWFNDVWMKEVFANFMAAKIVNPSFPDVNHELRFLLQHYPSAYDVDRTEGANPIRQPLANLNEAGSLYGAIIYQKAPIVMRQLEILIGADALRDGSARVPAKPTPIAMPPGQI